MRLLVVCAEPPESSFSFTPYRSTAPQPPAPGFPLHAPSVKISTVFMALFPPNIAVQLPVSPKNCTLSAPMLPSPVPPSFGQMGRRVSLHNAALKSVAAAPEQFLHRAAKPLQLHFRNAFLPHHLGCSPQSIAFPLHRRACHLLGILIIIDPAHFCQPL